MNSKMARFKKHIVKYGESPQIIAEREMGDASKWIELVKKNNLQYPYIVDTPEEKNTNYKHLVTLGDTLIIPEEKTLADIDTDTLNNYDKRVLEEIVLGNDLAVEINPKNSIHATEDEILELTGNGKGDIDLVRGRNNIIQMLYLRLLTPKGSLALHPDYGSNIQYLMGKPNNMETAYDINSTIQECLEGDSRIRSAKVEEFLIDGEAYESKWEISLYSFETYFKLLIQRDNDNNFLIL